MKILVICNDFPPLNSIGAQRPHSWYKYFKQFGADITILTKDWHAASGAPEEIIKNLKRKNTFEEDGEHGKVIRVPHKVILPEKMIARFGMGKYIVIRKFLTLLFRLGAFINTSLDKHANLYLAAKKYLKQNQVDVIITTGEPFILFKYGYLLQKKNSAKWVADFRDGWFHNHVMIQRRDALNRFVRRYEYYFEKKYLSRADLITSVDPNLTGQLGELHQRPTSVIYNGFWEFYEPAREVEKTENRQLVITHLGTLTPGQRVEYLLEIIKDLDEKGEISPEYLKVKFIGLKYNADQYQRVMGYDEKVKPYIDATERVPREEALKMTAESDYVLAFTEEKVKAIFAKNYDYLAVRRPILLIPDDQSILRQLINTLGAGHVIDSKEQLRGFLTESVGRKKNGEIIRATDINKEKASFYTREKQAAVFVERLNELTKK